MKFKIPGLEKIISGVIITVASALLIYGATEYIHVVKWEARSVEVHEKLICEINECAENQLTLKKTLTEKEKKRDIYYTEMFNKNESDHAALMNEVEKLTIQVKNLTWAVTRNNKKVEENLNELKRLNTGGWVIAQPVYTPAPLPITGPIDDSYKYNESSP